MLDCLIINAKIVDGTGRMSYKGCVGIKDGKFVTANGTEKAKEIIDAMGYVVAPGFIDVHSHGDFCIGQEELNIVKTNQGITTELMGNCGSSSAPVNPKNIEHLKNLLSIGTAKYSDDMINWTSFEKFLEYAETCKKTMNVRFMVGHNTLRIAVMGMINRPATKKELDRMKGILRESMESGAAGFSTGLIYTPGCYADENEVLELAKVIAPFDGIYASHMRNEAENLVKSTREVIEIGRKAGTRVNISHHKVMGKPNWGKQKQTLELISRANAEGMKVVCDQYPYTKCMTSTNACIPPWHLDGGYNVLCEKLKSKDFRMKIRDEMENPDTPYDNFFLNAGGWDGVYITSAVNTSQAVGNYVSEYAKLVGKDPWEAYFDMCIENNCTCSAVYSSMCEEDVCEIFKSPYCVVGTDGLVRNLDENGHPRACASFTHALTYFVKEKKIVTLEEAIRKMTGLSADYLNVKNKGYIKEGYDADLVIFDFDALHDTATYDKPVSYAEGINRVIVGGETVYKDMKLTGKCSGKVIRYNSKDA